MDTIKNNPVLSTIVIIIVVILVVTIVWKLYKLYKKNKLIIPMLWKPSTKVGPILNDKLVNSNGNDVLTTSNANNQDIVPQLGALASDPFILKWTGSDLPKPRSMEYSYSIWFRVDDWNYNYGTPKNIFFRGSELDSGTFSCNPGVWLHPVTNNIIIRVDTLLNVPEYERYNSISTNGMKMLPYVGYDIAPTEGKSVYPTPTENKNVIGDTGWNNRNELKRGILDSTNGELNGTTGGKFMPEMACDIKNIPSQTWVNLTLTLFNRTLDVFVNGKLHRSCTLRGIPRMDTHNNGDLFIGYSNRTKPITFDGDIARFKYWPRTMNAHEVYDYYKQGAKEFKSGLSKLIPDVKFQFAVNTGGKTYGNI